VKKVVSILAATAAAASCVLLGAGTASASDGCVRTLLIPATGRNITGVNIVNVCNYTLNSARGHMFAGRVDKWSPDRKDLRSGQGFIIPVSFTLGAGVLACGELVKPDGSNWGRDCITR
jgi:hypothetical protein